MEPTSWMRFASSVSMPAASSKAPSPRTCPWCSRASSSWLSTPRLPMLAIAPLILAASAQPLPPTSPPQLAPVLPPAHVVDLLTADGMAAFGAQWKHMEVKIIEGPALPNAMPDYKTSYDITPHAGVKGFDDSSWPTLEPKQLLDRRGGGKLSFLWYRTNLTMPAKIGVFDTANAKAVLTAYVDDYAEVWVNGEVPRRAGITSPATIQGFNIPISVVPPNFVFFRQASVEFYK